MLFVVLWAAILLMAARQGGPTSYLATLSIELIIPLYWIAGLGRPRTALDTWTAALSMIFLAWGASLRFWPVSGPTSWYTIRVFRELTFKLCLDLHDVTVRFNNPMGNWGLLAAFYSVIVLIDVARRFMGLRSLDDHGGSSPSAEGDKPFRTVVRVTLIAVAILLVPGSYEWFDRFLYFGAGPCGWLWSYPIGLVVSLVVAGADWQPRLPYYHANDFVLRLTRLMPAISTGTIAGFVWSIWGWGWSSFTAACSFATLLISSFPEERHMV